VAILHWEIAINAASFRSANYIKPSNFRIGKSDLDGKHLPERCSNSVLPGRTDNYRTAPKCLPELHSGAFRHHYTTGFVTVYWCKSWGSLSGTTWVSRYQKGKTNVVFTEARDSEWQWHQLVHMQICTSLQTDNHACTPPLSFLQAGCPSCRPTNSARALRATYAHQIINIKKQNQNNVQYKAVVLSCFIV